MQLGDKFSTVARRVLRTPVRLRAVTRPSARLSDDQETAIVAMLLAKHQARLDVTGRALQALMAAGLTRDIQTRQALKVIVDLIDSDIDPGS